MCAKRKKSGMLSHGLAPIVSYIVGIWKMMYDVVGGDGMRYIELSKIFVNGEELKCSSAEIVITELNGLKSWVVNCHDADYALTNLLIDNVGNVKLTMLDYRGKEFKGEAFAIDSSTLRGTGRLYGLD